jgi:hypothetical protein
MSVQFDDYSEQPIDLSPFDEEYARAEVRSPEGGGETIPDGHYDARIEDARLSRTPRTNNPMITWKLRILGPTHEGASLVKTRVITQKTLSWVKEDLELLGVRLERFSDLDQYLGQTVEREVRIFKKMGNNGWTDVYFSRAFAAAAAPGNGGPLPGEFDRGFGGVDDNLPF